MGGKKGNMVESQKYGYYSLKAHRSLVAGGINGNDPVVEELARPRNAGLEALQGAKRFRHQAFGGVHQDRLAGEVGLVEVLGVGVAADQVTPGLALVVVAQAIRPP